MTLFSETDLISTYTRKQAIDDGVLVDVSTMALEAGFKFPVAVTRTVWDEIITPDTIAKRHGESEAGRLWGVLWMLFAAIKRGSHGDTTYYQLIATKQGKQHTVQLKALCSPGDTPEPVITIMLPDED